MNRLQIMVLMCIAATTASADVLTFESLPVDGSGFYNGDIAGGSPQRDNYTVVGTQPDGFGNTTSIQRWTYAGVEFNNNFTPDPNFPSWNGWSWSRVEDTTTPGFINQYAASSGGGSNPLDASVQLDSGYLVGFSNGSFFNLPTGAEIQSVDVTNTTFAALSIRDGDMFSTPFGGASGDDPDLFQVTFTGFDGLDLGGTSTGSVTIDLADFRFSDNSLDFILTDWQRTDLTGLGNARSVGLTFSSTDSSVFGGQTFINTPAYVAFDNLAFTTAVPEPSSMIFVALLSLALIWKVRKSNATAAV